MGRGDTAGVERFSDGADDASVLQPALERVPEGQGSGVGEGVGGEIEDGLRVLEWEDMIPPDWQPDDMFAEYGDLGNLEDNDQLATELFEKLRQVWAEAPVVEALDGVRVKLPGFAIPLDFEAKKVREFLLVPYFGACIHAPPPPANQTVYVKLVEGREAKLGLYDTVWVTGTMSAKRFSSELAEAGYTLHADDVLPYENPGI